jgi:hypothetical protein
MPEVSACSRALLLIRRDPEGIRVIAVAFDALARPTRCQVLLDGCIVTVKLFQTLELLHLALIQLQTGLLCLLNHPDEGCVTESPHLAAFQLPASADICVAAWEPDLVNVLVVLILGVFVVLTGDLDR